MATASDGGGCARVCEGEREPGEGGRNERVRGRSGQLRGFVRGIEGVRGSRRWPAGGEVARARAGERRAHAVPLSGRKTTEEGGPGGLGRLLAGPPCCGWAAQGKPQVSPSFFISVFLFFF